MQLEKVMRQVLLGCEFCGSPNVVTDQVRISLYEVGPSADLAPTDDLGSPGQLTLVLVLTSH